MSMSLQLTTFYIFVDNFDALPAKDKPLRPATGSQE
jgi:hypothetical protein